jgi:hypothetical protein
VAAKVCVASARDATNSRRVILLVLEDVLELMKLTSS